MAKTIRTSKLTPGYRHMHRKSKVESSYPSIEDIDSASHVQLGYWMRYQGSPGACAIAADNFEDVLAIESAAQDLIIARFAEFGGWRPKVSKAVDAMHDAR